MMFLAGAVTASSSESSSNVSFDLSLSDEPEEMSADESTASTLSDPDLMPLECSLFSNKNYFFSWNGQRPIETLTDASNKKLFFDDLFHSNLKPIPRSVEQFDLHVPRIFSICEEVVSYFVEAFVLLVNEEFDEANKVIDLGELFLEYCIAKKYVDEEYLPGIEYLSKWLKLHSTIAQKKLPEQKIFETEDYEKLSDRAKAIVLSAKCYFLKSQRDLDLFAKEEAIECLRSITKLDPDSIAWHYYLGNWLKVNRKKYVLYHQLVQPPPGEEEKWNLWKTYDCCLKLPKDGVYDKDVCTNVALASVCFSVAEIVRCNDVLRQSNEAIVIGEFIFANTNEAIQFIRRTVDSMSEREDTAVFPELLRGGEILFNVLPKQFRNLDLAELLLDRAVKSEPMNSKVNHKFACFLVLKCEWERALKYVRDAVKLHPTNYPATNDLIKILMRSPVENKKEITDQIQKLLTRITIDPRWNEAQALTLRGCLQFMLKERNEAMKTWISAQMMDSKYNIFSSLIDFSERNHWPTALFNKEDLRKTVERHLTWIHLPEFEITIIHRFLESIRLTQKPRKRYVSESEADLDSDWRRPLAIAANNFTPYTSGLRRNRPPSPDNWRR